jgi:PucR C-terminal helix-turn-helix domain/GGDEF-like domain
MLSVPTLAPTLGRRGPDYDLPVANELRIARSVQDVLARLIAQHDRLAGQLAEQIRSEVSYYRDPSQAAHDLEDTCRAQLAAALGQLDLPDAMDATAARINGARQAEARVPLTALMDAYRVGSHFIWKTVAAACADDDIASEHILALADRLWLVQDAFTQSMAEGYRDVANARLLSEDAERASIVAALLQGQVLAQETLWDLATILQLPSRGPFVVVAAEVAELGRHALPAIESRLRVSDVLSAWQLRPDTQVGIVHVPTPTRQAALLAVLDRYPDVRLGISPPYLKLDQTGEALRFARIAMTAAPPNGGVIVFDDNPLLVASVAEPGVMRRVADTVLRPLASMRTDDRRILLDTFETWLHSGGSADLAAQQLFCHPNTVRQRLRRLEERTGRSLADPLDVTQLCLALEADRRLADPE